MTLNGISLIKVVYLTIITNGMISISGSTKVWLFILFTSLSILILGYQMAERLGLVIGFLISLALNVLIFIYGDYKLHNSFKSYDLSGQDAYGANKMISEYCQKLQIEIPKLKVYHSDSVNAFTLGLFWNQPTIYLSEKLIKQFSPEDLCCVLLLCLNQIQKMDTFAFGVVSVLANTLIGLGQFLDHIFLCHLFLRKEHWPFSYLFNSLCWLLVKSIANSDSFFKNDKSSCDLLGDKRKYCELLWRMDGYSKTLPQTIPPGTTHLFIVQPTQQHLQWFNQIHPPVPKRIVKLIGHSPL